MSFAYVGSVLFFAAVITANLLIWNSVMAKTDDTPGWLKWLLPGINVLAIVGATFVIAQLSERVELVRDEVSTLNNEVYRNDNSLKIRVNRIDDNLNSIRPVIVREDFENEIEALRAEITRLNQRIAELEAQLTELRR